MKGRLLVVEDDPVARRLLEEVLAHDGHQVRASATSREAFAEAERFRPQVVITDVQLEGASGLDLMAELRARQPDVQVIVVTAFGSLRVAVEAIRGGAFDYVSKPFRMEEICQIVQRALQARTPEEEPTASDPEEDVQLIGRGQAMTGVFKAIARVAPLKIAVLIQGETGTGKELVARAIHDAGDEPERPFVTVNCASFPEGLLESELFGYVKGAFTGATADRKGLFEAANGGTILLDEIGDMPLGVQAKLLRVLQSGEVRPVGSTSARTVDVRLLAATHQDLTAAVDEGRFRQDLFFRLNAMTIVLPPLRERLDDLPLLVDHFLRVHCAASSKRTRTLSDEAQEALRRYAWPGNVRELSHVLERAIVLSDGPRIDVTDLPAHVAAPTAPATAPAVQRLDEVERAHVLAVLKSVGGSRVRAAGILGIDRKTLYRKLLRYGLDQEAEPSDEEG